MRRLGTLDSILAALEKVDESVYYGIASKHDQGKPWNYTVFSRERTTPKDNLTGYTERYLVAVVRENYVPEDEYLGVIEAVSEVPGMKLDTSQGIEYIYAAKPGTGDVVEMMEVHFLKGRKA